MLAARQPDMVSVAHGVEKGETQVVAAHGGIAIDKQRGDRRGRFPGFAVKSTVQVDNGLILCTFLRQPHRTCAAKGHAGRSEPESVHMLKKQRVRVTAF